MTKKESRSSKKKQDIPSVSILTSECHFHGRMICKGISRIGGTIHGEIQSEGMLIIEAGAHVEAMVQADEVVVQGSLKGNVTISNRIEFTSTGTFMGKLETPNLYVIDGAKLNGQLSMQNISEARRDAKEIEKLELEPTQISEPNIEFET